MKNKELVIYVDGSCRANGKEDAISGIGIYATRQDYAVLYMSKRIQAKTNNEAEYYAVYDALKILSAYEFYNVTLYSDSRLVVKQLNDIWKIKEENLKISYKAVKTRMKSFKNLKIKWISRDKNEIANNLAQKITENTQEKI